MKIKLMLVAIMILSASSAIAEKIVSPSANSTDKRVLAWRGNVSLGKASEISGLQGQELIAALQKGGYVIYFRHTATEQKTEQWENIDLQDCGTQRNLSPLGQQQAEQIGKAFSSLQITVTKVLTSPFCRCLDTSKIAFGKAEISHDLLFSVGRDESLETALAALLSTKPMMGSNTVLVSHSSNLRDTTGIEPKTEGVAVIFKPHDDGSFAYVATVQPEDWPRSVKLLFPPRDEVKTALNLPIKNKITSLTSLIMQGV